MPCWPKNRVWLSATAAAVPHTVATMATRTPTRRLACSAAIHEGSEKKLVYHCVDHSSGGKLKRRAVGEAQRDDDERRRDEPQRHYPAEAQEQRTPEGAETTGHVRGP